MITDSTEVGFRLLPFGGQLIKIPIFNRIFAEGSKIIGVQKGTGKLFIIDNYERKDI